MQGHGGVTRPLLPDAASFLHVVVLLPCHDGVRAAAAREDGAVGGARDPSPPLPHAGDGAAGGVQDPSPPLQHATCEATMALGCGCGWIGGGASGAARAGWGGAWTSTQWHI